MSERVIGTVEEFKQNERLLAEVKGREIGIFRVDGEYRAYLNWCPHQGGPMCKGPLTGKQTATFDRESLETEYEWIKDDEVLVCPWHGWEFDLETGINLSRSDIELPSFPVREEDGKLIVTF